MSDLERLIQLAVECGIEIIHDEKGVGFYERNGDKILEINANSLLGAIVGERAYDIWKSEREEKK